MKILITGGAGFIGSEVVRSAILQGHSVLNLDKLTYASSLDALASVEESANYHFAKVDIQNIEEVEKIFFDFEPDSVMHLAAESHVDNSIQGPRVFVETNVLGTFNLLEVSRKYYSMRKNRDEFRFLHVSTDEVFGSLALHSAEKFTEDTKYDPHSPYSASKASSDFLVRAWHSTYGLPVLLSNCSNNYGPWQHREKLIPTVISTALQEKDIPVYGNGLNVRDWLHVTDHSDALFAILKNGKIGRSYNIGGNNEKTNIEIVGLICSALDNLRPRHSGHYSELIAYVKDRPGHDLRYAIDNTRILNEIEWKPKIDLVAGLNATVEWYLQSAAM